MLENINAPENGLFALALLLVVALFVTQLLGLLAGFRPFGFLDSLLPEADLDVPDASATGKIFGFLNLGRVPLIMTLDVFLFLFSCIGFNLQFFLHSTAGFRLPLWMAAPVALAASLPLTGIANKILARIIPQDESSALSPDTFIGRTAIITVGTVTHQRQSEARLRDALGRDQYVQVISDLPEDIFPAGSTVLLVARQGPLFTVIAHHPPQPEITK